MHFDTIAEAILLGIIEGLTEFLPVSSTAHLLLASKLLGFDSAGKAFEVLIQLGAILALLGVYAARLWRLLIDFPSDPRTRRFLGERHVLTILGEHKADVAGAGGQRMMVQDGHRQRVGRVSCPKRGDLESPAARGLRV